MQEESFKDLRIKSNLKFEACAIMSHKLAALSSFCEITKKIVLSLLIANIVKGAVSGLGQD